MLRRENKGKEGCFMNLYTKGKIIEPYFPTVFEAWGGWGGEGRGAWGRGGGGSIPKGPNPSCPPHTLRSQQGYS
jgi:hypothetical protein